MINSNKIGLVNCGSGNYGSVANALNYLKIDFREITKPNEFKELTHIILPGVGSFGDIMSRLSNLKILSPLLESISADKKYYLGICVGMQILVDKGYEFGIHDGLNLIQGTCKKLDTSNSNLRLPHIGWNDVSFNSENPLFEGIRKQSAFYFLHSYEVLCEDKQNEIAKCVYSEEVVAAIQKDNIFGVQFHPEKSQNDGLRVIKNFCGLA